MTKPEKTTPANQSSEKLLTLIEVLSAQDRPIRLQDLAKLVNMNASTVLRFLTALQNKRYVSQTKDHGYYYMTHKLCAIANNITMQMDVRKFCTPYLRSISQIFEESANLSIEEDMQVVYIEVINGPHQMLSIRQRIGNIAPMHCTGVGKLMLLDYNDAKINLLISNHGMPRFTENTITTKEALLQELETIRKQGYAFDNEECEIGARCIAVPIRNFTGQIVAGLSVSGPSTRMTDSHIYKNLPFLLDAAAAVSEKLGYDPDAHTKFS